jgi:DNA-binding NarL/FixJ family response regulator
VGSASALDLGRQAYARGRWQEAHESLTTADRETGLEPADLELLARTAYMLGRDDDYVTLLERAYRAHLDAGAAMLAVRCAFWIGHSLLFRGEAAPGFGWFARADRLVDRVGPDASDAPERGYALVGRLIEHLVEGDASRALEVATEIAGTGERFEEADLLAIGLMEQGHALVRLGRAQEGLRLIDETMVAVTSGELSPIVAGIVYCNTIAFCRGVYQLRRVREWTLALTRWCSHQPDMVAHKGVCLVHRAEIMTLGGAWEDALAELGRIGEEGTHGALNRLARGDAAYREGEVRRLRGELELAEQAYAKASSLGREPQPGRALVRLAQGRVPAAVAAIRRAVGESPRGLPRVALLPAYVEIHLAAGDLEAASVASRELDEIAGLQANEAIDAMSRQARGAVCLAAGEAEEAVIALRGAWQEWERLEAPYEAARSRALLGVACRQLGDEDSAELDLRAARDVLDGLGAAPEATEFRGVAAPDVHDRHGISAREGEVLRLVARGQSNREIAAALVISEHTVARHLQSIFAKLGVSSRTAAATFAHEHDLV